MKARWPLATYIESYADTAPARKTHFRFAAMECRTAAEGRADRNGLRGARLGNAAQNPDGRATTYSDIANKISAPKAPRAVGAAVGKNPISFVVPCHRVLGKSGALTGYHWGITRKQAMIGWETGRTEGQ